MSGDEEITLRRRRKEQVMSITDDEVEKYRDIFKILDKNNSNRISLAEFGMVLSNLGQIGNTSEDELKAVFHEIDSAKTGGINIRDFAKLMKSFEGTTDKEEEYRQVFQLLDSDKDGFISTQDLNKVLRPLSSMGERTSLDNILEMIQFADEGGSGKMNVNDFLEIMLNGNDI
eukprot:TRINITY_DN32775_c0_g1_i2.p1 TRINITY_DN32775_c0_g1~~TRINITY_DN32775_c0_g1_i2.p1  ORF type:complete len:173 (-),score=48.13 TRINITY_DN32775_c0_g1_i2:47-565(-)